MATPPPATSSTHHRKVELTTASDLAHLARLARAAASARLDAAFPLPPTAGGGAEGEEERRRAEQEPDALRASVADLLDAFVARTYAGVRANASAAGGDMQPLGDDADDDDEEDVEPLDAALAERVRALEARKQALTERAADLRRGGAARAAERWRAAWEDEAAADERDAAHDSGEDGDDVLREDGAAVAGVEIGELPRWDAVAHTHARALEGLLRLRTDVAATAGRLAEAVDVAEQLGGGGSR